MHKNVPKIVHTRARRKCGQNSTLFKDAMASSSTYTLVPFLQGIVSCTVRTIYVGNVCAVLQLQIAIGTYRGSYWYTVYRFIPKEDRHGANNRHVEPRPRHLRCCSTGLGNCFIAFSRAVLEPRPSNTMLLTPTDST